LTQAGDTGDFMVSVIFLLFLNWNKTWKRYSVGIFCWSAPQ